MPALPAVPNVIRFDLRHTLSEDVDVLNRIFLSYTGTNDPAVNLVLAGQVGGYWATDVMPELSSELELVSCTATDLSTSTSPESLSPFAVVGGEAGAQCTAGTAIGVRWHIGRRYRGGHPRVYLGGASAGFTTDAQTWTAAYHTALTNALTNFRTDLLLVHSGTVTATQQVNVSYYSGFHNITLPSGRETSRATPRAIPVVDVISAVSINPRVCSQRRRNLQSS